MLKILLWAAALPLGANIVVSLVLGHLPHYYNPNIRSVLTGFDTSVLGLFLILMLQTASKFNYSFKFLGFVAGLCFMLGCLGIAFQSALGFYLGAWGCIVWLFIALVAAYGLRADYFHTKQIEIQNQTKNIPLTGADPKTINMIDPPLQSEDQFQKSPESAKCCSRTFCCYCWHACCLVTTLLLMALFIGVAIAYYANLSLYRPVGQIFTLNLAGSDLDYRVHGYCVGTMHPTRPTIVLEHGGGANSIAFIELGQRLAARGWKMCTYDRLGYGRSSVVHHGLSIEKRTELTDKVIQVLLYNDANKDIIIGGWSAGVQISQIYRKLYPANVRGMVFFDGYPNYMLLTAIHQNKTTYVPFSTAGLSGILRVLQSFGLGFVVGANSFSNQTSNSYYRAYYQTGYFWQSQYLDTVNPNDGTEWLTQAAGTDTKPYPASNLSLNWPDIDVPLLVMPANATVSDANSGPMYSAQADKYLLKCTDANKLRVDSRGDHGFVINYAEDTAAVIDSFFSTLF